MKLVTEHEYKFGQKNIVPHLGLIEISTEGFIEIPEDQEKLALSLVEDDLGFSIVGEDKIIVIDSNPIEKTEKEKEEDLKKKSEDNDLGDKSEGDGLKPQIEDDTLNKVEEDPLGSSLESQDDIEGQVIKDVQIDTDTHEPTLTEEEKNQLISSLEGKTYQEMREYATKNNFPENEWAQKVNGPQMLKYLSEKIREF